MSDAVHEVAPDGRDKHYFSEQVDGVWTCECGEQADRYGKPMPPVIQVAR